ncbi:DUF5696 domain-containing protein [Paenibacillus spongiae]|uniref:DUF5696 domain-containing protein n=1 Tax=Paenibacillus spongiae TaxID=2909671 RepID=A0ABY5S382_9BACL|nr:DUF5696 domain-containing protein [Paenibacillus spongiae]UVI28359.1 DUF5696 domain-containing protein [Paenibacillus spongiae]
MPKVELPQGSAGAGRHSRTGRLWPQGKRGRIIVLAAGVCAAVLIVTAIAVASRPSLPALSEMEIQMPERTFFPVYQDAAWSPGPADALGFAEAADNGKFTLLVEPGTGQIAVRDRSSGYLWRSNPPADQLETETVKGLQLSNLQSPFILEYVTTGNTQRSMTNALEPKPGIRYDTFNKGLQASYAYPELQLSFVIQYELTDSGLEVSIPTQGIEEQGENRLLALNVLPFFGAVSAAEDEGYMFVPDGPGGLIRFDKKRLAGGVRYDYPIYGDEIANAKAPSVPREQIGYPVFGLKRGDHAYAAIVKEGKYTTWVKAMPAGIVSGYHAVSANFVYREEYPRRVSRLGAPINTMQKDRVNRDRRVEYRLLSGDEANYAGMAHAYRSYLEESGMLGKPLEAVEHVPLQLAVLGGAAKDTSGGLRYVPMTTFKQAEGMVEELAASGVQKLRLIYNGWQQDGYVESDNRFPVEAELGGESGAARLIQAVHDKGGEMWFADNIAVMHPDQADVSAKTEGMRGVDGTVVFNRKGQFMLNPQTSVRAAKNTVDRFAALGADGLLVDGPGKTVFRDYNSGQAVEREDTAHLYQSFLGYVQERFPLAGTVQGNDYALRNIDLIIELPTNSSYDVIIDETVPFYPIAVHGSVAYTAAPGNLRQMSDEELLRAIEYGAVPYYILTDAPSRRLIGTSYDNKLYSSEFAVWKDRVAEEYKKFDQLAHVYNQRIRGHRKLNDYVFVTTYEDGTEVTVDYKANRFDVAKGAAR